MDGAHSQATKCESGEQAGLQCEERIGSPSSEIELARISSECLCIAIQDQVSRDSFLPR
jgi:hypothetical protein